MVHHVVHLAVRTAVMILVYVLAVCGFVALLTFIVIGVRVYLQSNHLLKEPEPVSAAQVLAKHEEKQIQDEEMKAEMDARRLEAGDRRPAQAL